MQPKLLVVDDVGSNPNNPEELAEMSVPFDVMISLPRKDRFVIFLSILLRFFFPSFPLFFLINYFFGGEGVWESNFYGLKCFRDGGTGGGLVQQMSPYWVLCFCARH